MLSVSFSVSCMPRPGIEHYMFSSGRMIFFVSQNIDDPSIPDKQSPRLFSVAQASLRSFVSPAGIEHYMFSTPFGYILSLRSESSSKGLRYLRTKIKSQAQDLEYYFGVPSRNRTYIKSLEVSCSIH